MNNILQAAFFLLLRPFLRLWLGVGRTQGQSLPKTGPAIIVANHNSHLDTLILMSLFPVSQLRRLRPVAAADYFLSNRVLAGFAKRIINILPIHRKGEARDTGDDPLTGCLQALDAGEILILYPEGSRGQPDGKVGEFKRGLENLARQRPAVPVYPIHLSGTGDSFPKGAWLPLPARCGIAVGQPQTYTDTGFLTEIRRRLIALKV